MPGRWRSAIPRTTSNTTDVWRFKDASLRPPPSMSPQTASATPAVHFLFELRLVRSLNHARFSFKAFRRKIGRCHCSDTMASRVYLAALAAQLLALSTTVLSAPANDQNAALTTRAPATYEYMGWFVIAVVVHHLIPIANRSA
jgi:hypothetical protein